MLTYEKKATKKAVAGRDYSEMLHPDDTLLIMIDHQAGLFLFPGDIEPVELRNNAVALAKVGRLFQLPVVFTAADQGPKGPIGPIIPEITDQFPGAEVIYRTKINSWFEPAFRAAVEATGRKKVVIAGIDSAFCIGLPAKSLVADGYDVTACIDASGNLSELTRHTTIANLTQAGVRCSNWVDVACQLLGDWAADEAKSNGLLDIYDAHLPQWGMLGILDNARRRELLPA